MIVCFVSAEEEEEDRTRWIKWPRWMRSRVMDDFLDWISFVDAVGGG